MVVVRANRTFGIAAILVALLCSATVLVGCHGDCHEDDCSACCAACCDVCRCATVQAHGFDFDPTYTSFITGGTVYLPSAAVTDVFRPPKSLA